MEKYVIKNGLKKPFRSTIVFNMTIDDVTSEHTYITGHKDRKSAEIYVKRLTKGKLHAGHGPGRDVVKSAVIEEISERPLENNPVINGYTIIRNKKSDALTLHSSTCPVAIKHYGKTIEIASFPTRFEAIESVQFHGGKVKTCKCALVKGEKTRQKNPAHLCRNTNNGQWAHCSVCSGRVHSQECTTRRNKKIDCCKERHEMLYAQGQTMGIGDESIPMLGDFAVQNKRQKNPVINGGHRDVKKALKLYKEFREATPKRGRQIEFDMPKVLMILGNVRFIGYDTTRKGKTELYKHDFAAGSRPLLCADGESGQLFIVEGRYHVTPRGIVDIDSRGKEIDD